ncbi:type II secretion system protein GspC [Vulgatibacter incomptus]|uniref:General secretion pathway protein C n=1 Tax=Vulgatibacter incomptus TaxID=1391653 RepID=A0A0K1PDX1_9BACT|nr:type II secretion system protein GspC [Vulgatibacter incomptus]AKU91319.1 General secretion pathway protein C [Vulgatibacter incomptus]
MELLFRKYFWTLNLAFLAVAALLCAGIANSWITSKIAPGLSFGFDVPVRAPPPTAGGPARLHLETTASFLGIVLPKDEPVAIPREPVFDPNAAPVRSSLRVSLIGTMVANRPEWSLATIRDDNARETGVYMPGDRLLGAEVLEIERLRVIIKNEGRKEYIALGEIGPPPPPMTAVSAVPPAVSSGGDANVRQIDDNNYEITRDELDKQLSNLNAIATQARIVPSFKNGVANGFKLFSIRPGSLYSKIGIENGDVIRKINGFEINSPEKALELYAKLKESSKVELELERRGQVIPKSYVIR